MYNICANIVLFIPKSSTVEQDVSHFTEKSLMCMCAGGFEFPRHTLMGNATCSQTGRDVVKNSLHTNAS